MSFAASAAPLAPAGAALEDVCPACLQLRHTTGTTPVTLASFLSSVLMAKCLPAAMASHTLWTRCSRRPTLSNWLWWTSLASTPLLLAHRKSLSEACCVLTLPVGLAPAMHPGDLHLLHTHVASAACRSIGVRPTRNISSPASSSLYRKQEHLAAGPNAHSGSQFCQGGPSGRPSSTTAKQQQPVIPVR